LPSSERLFHAVTYVLFVAPAAVVAIWAIWRLMVWCLFYTGLVSTWMRTLPIIVQIPLLVGLLLSAWPLLLLAFMGWTLVRIFPGLALAQGEVPQLFARNRSRAVSYVFLFLLGLPLIRVPMMYLAERLEGPKNLFWHWILVCGSILVLAFCFLALIRRKQD